MLLDSLRAAGAHHKLPEPPTVRNDKWALAKVILRSTSFLLALVAIFESAFISSSSVESAVPVVLSVASICVLWDAAEFYTIFRRDDRSKGIKPVVHVGVEGVLGIGGCLTTALQVSFTLGISSKKENRQENKGLLGVSQTLCGILSLLSLLHLMLCLRSCVEIRRIREHKRIEKLVLELSSQHHVSQERLASIMPSGQALSEDHPSKSKHTSVLEIDSKELIQELSAVECFELPANNTFPSNQGQSSLKE